MFINESQNNFLYIKKILNNENLKLNEFLIQTS